MPLSSENRLTAAIDRVALLVALTVALVIPLGYGTLGYRNLAYHESILARVKADAITILISANPSYWRYEPLRLEELLAKHPEPVGNELISAYDQSGDLLVRVGSPPEKPWLSSSYPLYDSGQVVGKVEVQSSLRELIFGTGLAALLGMVLGAAVQVVLSAWPKRALRRMNAALQSEQAALRASEERLRTLFERASEGILILRPNGKLVSCNSAFARMHGYSIEEVLQLDIQSLDTPSTRKMIADRMVRILQGEPIIFEVEHYRKDGSVFPLEVSASIIPADGEPLIQAFHRDVSERKAAEAERDRLEEQLRQSQKMEALGTLAGGIAHDFNNALAAIFGNLELVRQDLDAGHVAQESLAEIGKATRRAKALVQQILAFGRRQPLERKRIALRPIVEESARLLRSAMPAGIKLGVTCAPDAPPVMADTTQVQQILLNLGNNAWQAIRSAKGRNQQAPGAIEIRLDAYNASGEPYTGPERRILGKRIDRHPGRYAMLTVRDDGPGMDRMMQQRIFEPFFTTKPTGEGSGLGLAVVHGIVQSHQATIEVQSEPGAGTSFRIYFKEADAQPGNETEDPAKSDAPGGEKTGELARRDDPLVLEGEGTHVLYVDDDESIVFLMTRLLQRKGYRVSAYSSGEEALLAARADPLQFDLAVTDYNMPGMSGLELATKLHALRSDLPVVIASGDLTDELRANAPAAGVQDLIYKPNAVDDLCEAIARLATSLHAGRSPAAPGT